MLCIYSGLNNCSCSFHPPIADSFLALFLVSVDMLLTGVRRNESFIFPFNEQKDLRFLLLLGTSSSSVGLQLLDVLGQHLHFYGHVLLSN